MILQALCGYYQRAKAAPGSNVVDPGYAVSGVSGEIVLDRNGNVTAVNPLFTDTGKKKVPLRMAVPLPPKRAGQKPAPAFLYETVSFLFGVYGEPEGAAYRFDASRQLHETVLAGCDDDGARAVLAFFQKRVPGSTAYEGADTSLLKDPRLFVVFRLKGDTAFLHDRPKIRSAWEQYNRAGTESAPVAQCLVTGETLPIAVLHGNVSGFGADKPTLVGFNQDSFCSFGKTGRQGENAPVSQRAAFEYVTALNMLCTDPGHSFFLGGDKVLFWAERDAPREENLLAMIFGARNAEQPGLDEAQSARIRGALHGILSGGDPADFGLEKDVRFYMLGAGANKTRLVIRFFYESSFGEMMEHLAKHYRDLSVDGMRNPFPAPFSLLLETAVQHKSENILPNLESALMTSILNGTPYPLTLYQNLLLRIRAEKTVSGQRAGMIKATINRKENREVLKMALDRDERDPAYLLGRLFALMERTQYLALGDVNSTLTDKYLNSALATPQMVFPVLLVLNSRHLSKLAKERPGAAVNIQKEKGAILDALQLSSDDNGKYAFPPSMDSNEQGKFLVGYYHQTQAAFKDSAAAQKETENNEGGSSNVDR